MSTAKKIWFVVIIILVVSAIGYLESRKAHPAANGGGAAQTINIGAAPDGSSTPSAASSTTSTRPSSMVLSSATLTALAQIAAQDKAAGDPPAIEIVDPTGFINVSSTFKLSNLVGHDVVLLDFWTYSCINCVRTIPYLNAWYAKYKNYGLVIVGVHTPEFAFEKNLANVQNAVEEYGIHYPVILDSNQGTWNAYNNLYWPAEYMIDVSGYIAHTSIGEGNYAETEAEIQKLLMQRATALGLNPAAVPTGTVNITAPVIDDINSPETYFGAARNSLLANGAYFANGNQTLTTPVLATINGNQLYLGGTWDFEDQYATNLTSGATITYEYDAGKVYMVAAGAANGTVLQVMQDGQPITAADSGSDVKNGTITISGNRLYNIVSNADGGGEHTLQLIVQSPGLQAYTFTFG